MLALGLRASLLGGIFRSLSFLVLLELRSFLGVDLGAAAGLCPWEGGPSP